jgi:hypothetical protein
MRSRIILLSWATDDDDGDEESYRVERNRWFGCIHLTACLSCTIRGSGVEKEQLPKGKG